MQPDWEQKILEAAINGTAADFTETDERDRTIAASALRRLFLLVQQNPGEQRSVSGHCVRWEIDGAIVEGTLDLRGGRIPGGNPIAPLRFVNCTFKDGFRADGAHLGSLSFEGCRFGLYSDVLGNGKSSISLRDTRVGTEFRLSGAQPLNSQNRFLLDARAIYVGTNFVVRATSLEAGPMRKKKGVSPGPYALDLRNAEIRANLFLQPDVEVRGGVRLESARIGGNLCAEGLFVTDGEDSASRKALEEKREDGRQAINAQSVHLEGHLLFRREAGDGWLSKQPFQADGDIDMFGIKTGGTLDFTGARINNRGSSNPAIRIASGMVGGNLIASEDLEVEGGLMTYGAAIQGTFELHGSLSEMDGRLMQVGGDTIIDVRASSSVYLTGAHLKGSLDFKGYVENLFGNLLNVEGDTTLSMTALNLVNLGGANLKGNLDLSKLSFQKPAHPPSISNRPESKRDLQSSFLGLRPVQRDEVLDQPRLSLRDADIGHSLSLAQRGKSEDWEQFRNAHWTKLGCYPGYYLVEIPVRKNRGEGWTAYLCKTEEKPIQLNGNSSPFHELNSKGGIDLGNEQKVKEYLRLFCSYVWGDEGPFVLIENPDQLRSEDNAQLEQIHEIELSNLFEPQQFAQLLEQSGLEKLDAEGQDLIRANVDRWAVKADVLVRYGAVLFAATLGLWTNSNGTGTVTGGSGALRRRRPDRLSRQAQS